MLTKQHMHLAVKMILVKYIWEKKRKVWWLALDSCVAFPLVPYNLVKMIAVLIDASPWIRTMHLIYFRGMHGADHFFTLLEKKKKTFSHKFTCCVYPF